MTKPTVFHSLAFRDADAGIAFLTALGFEERLVVRNETDPGIVEHAQFHWGGNGAIMFGSAQRADTPGSEWERRVGVASCYLVVPTDADVDEVYQRAMAAGATSLQEPVGQDYGGRSAGVADPEGNQWSIGSYPGE
ncbi:VOC family protein [Granulicoccus sp. GXG6511]|uniref:VOC family protein n=1 Tax=Granulicoccus sp. GXG6511 TaxID=3381351 RepID=UPI003D7EF734